MKNYDILLEILNGKEIWKKYYQGIRYKDFYEIVSYDPKTVIDNGQIKKVGPYSKILLKLFLNKKLRREDLEKAKEYLSIAYHNKIPLDLSKINTLNDVFDNIKHKKNAGSLNFFGNIRFFK